MIILLSLLIATSAVLHLRADHLKRQSQIYLFKPLTATLILLLAVNRFRRPFSAAQPIIMSTYFTAQWLIALSV